MEDEDYDGNDDECGEGDDDDSDEPLARKADRLKGGKERSVPVMATRSRDVEDKASSERSGGGHGWSSRHWRSWYWG